MDQTVVPSCAVLSDVSWIKKNTWEHFFTFLLILISPFLPHRQGEILALFCAFPVLNSCYWMTEEQHHSSGLYPVTGGFSFPASSTSYKPSGSEPFILCEHFPYCSIWSKSGCGQSSEHICIRESAADRRFSPFHRTFT